MQNAMKYFWILTLIAMAFAVGRCGRISNASKKVSNPEVSPYIPDSWDGEEDWPENALKVEDITP